MLVDAFILLALAQDPSKPVLTEQVQEEIIKTIERCPNSKPGMVCPQGIWVIIDQD